MNTERLNNFDLLRLFAASEVIFSHTSIWLQLPVNIYFEYIIKLFPGVAIFFIISGFLVVKSYLDSGGNLKRYSLARILRIYPGLWINVLIISLLLFITGAFKIQDMLTYHFIAHQIVLLLTGNNCPSFICGNYPFKWNGFFHRFPSGVLWTITVELGFYVLVPLIFSLFIENKIRLFYIFILIWLLISGCFSALNTHLITSNSIGLLASIIHDIILPYLWIFILGSLIFLNWKTLSVYLMNKFLFWLIIYIFVSLIFLQIHHDRSLNFQVLNFFNIIRVILLSACVISFAFSFKSLNFLCGKIDLSYGAYLYHMQIVFILLFMGYTHSWYLWIIVYACTFLVAFLSWILIEKPCLRLKKRKVEKIPKILQSLSLEISNEQSQLE